MDTSKSLPPSGLPQQFHPLPTSSCPFAPHVVASSHNNPERVTLYHHRNPQTLDHRDASPAYAPRNAVSPAGRARPRPHTMGSPRPPLGLLFCFLISMVLCFVDGSVVCEGC
ncbi:hypothetical protein BS47DRAFT_1341164, partial [Hydnum rufescens UP504]